MSKIIAIFDAFRDEPRKIGRSAGLADLCIRRQVTMLGPGDDAAAVVETVLSNMRKYLEADPRFDTMAAAS